MRRETPSLFSFPVGCEPPPVLDFKYSDPIAAVNGIVEEIAALLGGTEA